MKLGFKITAPLLLLVEKLRASYWILPAGMLVMAGGLAFFMVGLDRRYSEVELEWLRFLYSGGSAGAHAVLSAIAASVLGVAGTTFAITIAVLSLTSSQYGPRLLRSFLRDIGTQTVLGVFIGTFLYALLVMGTVRGVDESLFVPRLAAGMGIVLAVVSVFMLVFFIQHVVASIQASSIIRVAGKEFTRAVTRMCPPLDEPLGGSRDPDETTSAVLGLSPAPGVEAASAILASKSGYIQALDIDGLVDTAREHDARIDLLRAPGDFVAEGTPLARATPSERVCEELARQINDQVSVGPYPTATQDIAHGPRQLSEIALRALSPGINDPNTAKMCLDQLCVGLSELARRQMPPNLFHDSDGNIHVTLPHVTFESIVDAGMGQIRRYGAGDVEVLSRMLGVLADVGSATRTTEQRQTLAHHAALARAAGESRLSSPEERERLAAAFAAFEGLLRALEEAERTPGSAYTGHSELEDSLAARLRAPR